MTKTSHKSGEEYIVRAKAVNGDGTGICDIGGFVAFVRGILPGEYARVRLTDVHDSYAKAELIELRGRSADRIRPACGYFGRCSGCDFMHMPYVLELESKRKVVTDAFKRVGGLRNTYVEPVTGDLNLEQNTFSYRYRNKGHYVYSKNEFGFYETGTHNVIAIDDCLLQKRRNSSILSTISEWLHKSKVADIKLSDVIIRTGEATDEVLIILNFNISSDIYINSTTHSINVLKLRELAEILSRQSSNIRSIVANIANINNKSRTNARRGLNGSSYIEITGSNKSSRIQTGGSADARAKTSNTGSGSGSGTAGNSYNGNTSTAGSGTAGSGAAGSDIAGNNGSGLAGYSLEGYSRTSRSLTDRSLTDIISNGWSYADSNQSSVRNTDINSGNSQNIGGFVLCKQNRNDYTGENQAGFTPAANEMAAIGEDSVDGFTVKNYAKHNRHSRANSNDTDRTCSYDGYRGNKNSGDGYIGGNRRGSDGYTGGNRRGADHYPINRRSFTLLGDGAIDEKLGPFTFRITHDSFFQTNTRAAETLCSLILEQGQVGRGDNVINFFCGTGAVSAFLANKASSVTGVESSGVAIKDALINAETNNLTNLEFIEANAEYAAESLLHNGVRPDLVVLDPPGRGCDEKLLRTINRLDAERIIYVSGDPAMMCRDISILASGRTDYAVSSVQPVDMLPRTANIETVVLLEAK